MDMQTFDATLDFPVSEKQAGCSKIADLPDDLEYQGSFVASAIRCRNLGWRLAAVDARELVDLEVNFDEPVEHWLHECRQTGSLEGRVNLGVHTGSASGLVVLEVANGEGKSALDYCGSWRSPCQARMNGREQHYYKLPAGIVPPPTRFLMAAQVMVYGEGGLAPLPPSVNVQNRESWKWLNPPWEYPPPELPQCLQDFFKQLSSQPLAPVTEPEIPSWEEIYRFITPHDQLLKALLAPYRSLREHYGHLLDEARAAGFTDQKFLLGLLWHAPQGDVLENPGRLAELKRMVQEASLKPADYPESRSSASTPGPESEKEILVNKSHYEVILGELRRLKHKTAELEALLLNWGPIAGTALTPAPLVPEAPSQASGDHAVKVAVKLQHQDLSVAVNESLLPTAGPGIDIEDADVWRNSYSELSPKAQSGASTDVMEATITACLQRNPDLAQDPVKLQMVQYCFKNYVNIDPGLSDLSLLERVERASQMAREFLGGQELA